MRTNNIKQKVKEYFLNNPTKKLRVRQIERTLNLPLPSIIRYTKELVKEKILEIENIANIKLFKANYGSSEYLLEKKLHNIKQLYTSGLINYLIEEYSNPPIILFGSFSRGEDIEDSDIDIYIETPAKDKPNLEKFEKILQKEIQVFIHKNLKNISNPHLANNIINGMTLNGFIEIIEEKDGWKKKANKLGRLPT